MKNKIITMTMVGIMAFSLMACGVQQDVANSDNLSETVQEDAEDDAAASEETVEEKEEAPEIDSAAILEEYANGLSQIVGTTFKMSGSYSEDDGIISTIDGESGNVLYIYENDNQNLITGDYSSNDNTFTFTSYGVSDAGEIEELSKVSIDNFIEFNDSLEALITKTTFYNEKNSIMVESNSMAYTYADGVKYDIRLIEICEDGTLDMYYDDGVAGSGDEDITSMVRESFNEATGCDFSKDIFEDAFYNGNLLIKQENDPILANVSFKSESAKVADTGDWNSAGEIASAIYNVVDGTEESVYWGEGKFE